jgi:hypothetical protein
MYRFIVRSLYRFFLASSLLIFLLSWNIPSAYAGPAQRLLQKIGRRELFLGGKPPKIINMTAVKELKDPQSGKYVYMYKAIVRRASGERNGLMTLLRAKSYRHAFVQLYEIDPSTQWWFDTFAPKTVDNAPFPPVLVHFKYHMYVDMGGWWLTDSTGIKWAKSKTKFVQYLSRGLEPGSHRLKMKTVLELGDHPIKSAYSLVGWFATVLKIYADPMDFVAGKVAGVYTEWLSLTGLGKKILKKLVLKGLTESWVEYRLTVLAKVPRMKGMKPSEAIAELKARNLNYRIKDIRRCPNSMENKVYRHKAGAGKKVKAGTSVTLVICRPRNDPSPQPAAPLRLLSASYPSSVVSGGARGDMVIKWSGEPAFPVEVLFYPQSCPPGVNCTTVRGWINSKKDNPLLMEGAVWCRGFAESTFFDYAVKLVDRNGQETKSQAAGFTCQPAG